MIYMSMRDHFAGIALERILAGQKPGGWNIGRHEPNDCTDVARAAYAMADAMLAARKETGA